MPYAEDGRKVVVHLTNDGKEMMGKIFPIYHKIEDFAVSNLSKREFKVTRDELRNILHTMEEVSKLHGDTE